MTTGHSFIFFQGLKQMEVYDSGAPGRSLKSRLPEVASSSGKWPQSAGGGSSGGWARSSSSALLPFLGWEGSSTKIDYRKKGTVIQTSPSDP